MTVATILDYGSGNLHSLAKAMALAPAQVRVVTDASDAVRDTDILVLPGVGAFAAATERMGDAGRTAIREAAGKGLPILGICLGMQLLFERSDEGPGEGLGLLAGHVTRLQAARVPQIGWNAIEKASDVPLAALDFAYYANGFVCRPVDEGCVTAWSTHEGDRFPAAVRSGAVMGVQFHPEKSSNDGVRFLSEVIVSSQAIR